MKCKNCGGCCENYLPLDDNEIRLLKIKAKEMNYQPLNKNPKSCPFLTPLNLCSIYTDRPEICKAYHCQVEERKLIFKPKRAVNIRQVIFRK